MQKSIRSSSDRKRRSKLQAGAAEKKYGYRPKKGPLVRQTIARRSKSQSYLRSSGALEAYYAHTRGATWACRRVPICRSKQSKKLSLSLVQSGRRILSDPSLSSFLRFEKTVKLFCVAVCPPYVDYKIGAVVISPHGKNRLIASAAHPLIYPAMPICLKIRASGVAGSGLPNTTSSVAN